MKFNLYRYAWGKNSIFTKQMLKMLDLIGEGSNAEAGLYQSNAVDP
jgi:hypothetical protein